MKTRQMALSLVLTPLLALLIACGVEPVATPLPATEVGVAPTNTPVPPTDTPVPLSSTPTITSSPASVSIRLEADGSGDYATLEEAVEKAPSGAVIGLGPGVFTLEKSLDIRQSLKLVGSGMDQTEIVSDAPAYVVRFNGDGPFAAEDITFRHEGEREADVVTVMKGEVALVRCRFTGAVDITESAGFSGQDRAGLRLSGQTRGVVRDCQAVRNARVGILLVGAAKPTLEGNTCSGNTAAGISYITVFGAVARRNDCSENLVGISVGGGSDPVLEENVCSDNAWFGIAYWQSGAAGTARQNECSRNGASGIFLAEQAEPVLEENIFFDNGDSDISERFDLDVAVQRLGTLESYTAMYSVLLIPESDPEVPLLQMAFARIKSTESATLVILRPSLGDPNGGLEEQARLIVVGDRIYARSTGEGWVVMRGRAAEAVLKSMAQVFDPRLEKPPKDAQYLYPGEIVGGVPSHRYQYRDVALDAAEFLALAELPPDTELTDARLYAWTSIKGGLLVGYTYALEPKLDSDSRAWLSVDFRLLNIDAPFKITPPKEVTDWPFPGEVPLPDDASLWTTLDMMAQGAFVFMSDSPPAAIADYYRAEMPENGWAGFGAAEDAGTYTFIYTHDDRCVELEIGTDAELGKTVIHIEPGVEETALQAEDRAAARIAADSFLTALQVADYAAAYDLCAPSLQAELGTAEDLRAYVQANGIEPLEWTFLQQNRVCDMYQLIATALFAGEQEKGLQVVLIQVDGDWLVAGFHVGRLSTTGGVSMGGRPDIPRGTAGQQLAREVTGQSDSQ